MKGSISVEAKYDQIKSILNISVKDTGIGVRKEQKLNLFKLFWKSSFHKESGDTGFGLGLTICKYLVEKLGGEIIFRS